MIVAMILIHPTKNASINDGLPDYISLDTMDAASMNKHAPTLVIGFCCCCQ
jgi:hypothetical protein